MSRPFSRPNRTDKIPPTFFALVTGRGFTCGMRERRSAVRQRTTTLTVVTMTRRRCNYDRVLLSRPVTQTFSLSPFSPFSCFSFPFLFFPYFVSTARRGAERQMSARRDHEEHEDTTMKSTMSKLTGGTDERTDGGRREIDLRGRTDLQQ